MLLKTSSQNRRSYDDILLLLDSTVNNRFDPISGISVIGH